MKREIVSYLADRAMSRRGVLGAAGKAVVYQWESRKRWPSAVFWRRIVLLQQLSLASVAPTV